MKKTFTKHILLLALMLFGVAGAAWASRAPQKFTGPVDIYDLMDGDTLASGFSLTYGHGQQEIIRFVAGRYSIDGTPQAYPGGADLTGDHELQSLIFTASNILMYFGEERTDTIAPMVDMSTPGNAWVVSDFNKGTEGVTMKISGIYIAPDPTVPALDELTGNWNFLMPGSNKVVKAVLLDSIVLGPHVELYDAQPAFAAGDIYHRGDSTIYYYDTNNHHSFHLRADEQAGGKYFGFWSDLDPTDPQYIDRTNRYVSPGYLTCGQRFTAAYPNNHTLTLVTPQGGGTLELAGVRVDTFYNITFEHDGSSGDNRSFTIPASRLPYDTTFNYDEDIYPASVNEPSGNLSIISQGGQSVTISISGAFIEHDGSYSCMFLSEDHDNWTISCEDSIVPVIPYGIRKTGNGTYSVMEGLTVNVTATPDSAHYLSAIGNEAVISNSAYNISFTMPDDDAELAATFTTKPTLTLDQTDGGTLEAIVPEPAATAIVPPTDQMDGWGSNHSDVLMESNMPAEFGFVAVDQAAAEAWTGAPATGDAMLIYGIEEETFYYVSFHNGSLMGNSTAFFSPGSFYQMASAGILYITTGVTPGNVIASSTPNTYYIDYGTPVTVVATPDAQHYLVSFSDDAPATERNSNLAVEKTYDSVIADIPNLSANFQAKPVLTLTANDGGTLTIDMPGYVPSKDTIIQLPDETINGWSTDYTFLTTADLPGFVASDTATAVAWTDAPSGSRSTLIFKFNGNAPQHWYWAIYNNSGVYSQIQNQNSTRKNVYNMKNNGSKVYYTSKIPAVLPAGVAMLNDTTFMVDYGTEVTVKATPKVHYHLEGWSNNVTDNGDSTATLTLTQDETVSATFAQNAPELAWEYDDETLANGDTLSAYHGFEMDTIAKLIFSSNDEFFDAYMNALQNTGTSLLRFGSSNTNVVSFANPYDPQSLSVNAPGTATVYMVHDGSVMAYDSAYFTAVILAPDTLTLVHNDGGAMEVELGSNESTLLTTVTATGETSYSQSPDGIVTVTLNNISSYSSDLGWYFGGIVTVEAAQGYTITRCVFKQYPNSFPNRVLVDDLAPFTATMAYNGENYNYYVSAATSTGEVNGDDFMNGISTIEVYGYAAGSDSIRAIVTDTTYAVVPGANVTVKATPDSAHYLVNWDNDAAIYSNTDTTKHYVVNGNVTSTATFRAKPTLTLAQNENWGTVGLQMVGGSGVAQLTDSSYMIDYGTEVTVQAEATTLHHIAGWISEDSVAYPADSITYGNYFITEPDSLFPALSMLTFTVTADTTAEALFGLNSYDVFATAQLDDRDEIGSGLAMGRIAVIYTNVEGSVQGAGPADTLTYTAQGGSNSMLVVNSSYGYDFSGWYDVAADTLLSDAAMLSLTAAATVEARFVPDTFEVSTVVAVPGDTLAAAGTVTGAARYAYREMVTLEETPATGYHFVNWTAADSSVVGTDDSLTLQLVKDTVLTANFDTNVYNVVADVNIEGLGTVTGAGEVKHFLSTTLVATANLKYHFVMWVNAAGDSVSAADTLEVFPVGDTALTAVFDTNIYATVWSGETDTTYTSLPYEGLTATYTDFWGNEHTPVLTFVCGDQTVVTPNYPVTAGTWTVTATGAEGDSLTAPETTLTIKRAIVNVTGAVVETAKFADGTTTAVVTNAGTLNNVQGSDRVQHTTTAAYNTATVGDNKTITVTYALNGAAALLANYTLTPTTEVYTTEGYIIEPMVPNTDRPEDDTTVVEQGFDVYAYGYCTGSGYSIRYHLNTGAPDQYKLDFADSRFTDVDWTNLATPGADGTIDIMVPVDMPMGDYSVTVTFRDSRFTWLESAPMTMNFHINLPETFTMPLFNNVIALVDTCQCFSDIQWYHRANSSEEWKAIPGANGYYYHATDAELEGEFFVKAKYNGVETFTCPQTDMETLYTDDEQTVSVTAYPNPTTDGVTITVDGGTEWVHTLRVLSTVGVEKESRTFEGFTTTVDMRGYAKGAYMVIVDGVVVRVVRN